MDKENSKTEEIWLLVYKQALIRQNIPSDSSRRHLDVEKWVSVCPVAQLPTHIAIPIPFSGDIREVKVAALNLILATI